MGQVYTTDTSWIHEEWSLDERNDGWSFDEWNDDWNCVGGMKILNKDMTHL